MTNTLEEKNFRLIDERDTGGWTSKVLWIEDENGKLLRYGQTIVDPMGDYLEYEGDKYILIDEAIERDPAGELVQRSLKIQREMEKYGGSRKLELEKMKTDADYLWFKLVDEEWFTGFLISGYPEGYTLQCLTDVSDDREFGLIDSYLTGIGFLPSENELLRTDDPIVDSRIKLHTLKEDGAIKRHKRGERISCGVAIMYETDEGWEWFDLRAD